MIPPILPPSDDFDHYPVHSLKHDDLVKLREWGFILDNIIENQIIEGVSVQLISNTHAKVTLPTGWQRIDQPNQHCIIDDKKLIRAVIYFAKSGDVMIVNKTRYEARSYCEDPEAAYHYHVFDLGKNDEIVRSYPAVYWGYDLNDRTTVGIIKGKLFHSNPFKINRVIRFTKIRPANKASKITYEDFLDNYHGNLLKRGAFMEIEAGDNLAKMEAIALADKLNREVEW